MMGAYIWDKSKEVLNKVWGSLIYLMALSILENGKKISIMGRALTSTAMDRDTKEN